MEKTISKQEQTKRSEELLKTALSVSEETNAVGAEILNNLAIQGEQLGKLHGKLDNIDNNQVQANKYLNVISSVGGYISNLFAKDNKPIRSLHAINLRLGDKVSDIPNKPMQNKTIQQTKSNENNELLDQLSNSIGRLKEMGTHINTELDSQNETIDQLDQHVDHTTNRMRKLNYKIIKLT